MHCFIIQPLILQKPKPLYPNLKYCLELGFEFGLQRIRDLAFMCPHSVHTYHAFENRFEDILLPNDMI